MLVRNHRLQRLVAVLLVTLVALSAQAWASHVDWPQTHGDGHVHVDLSALDAGKAIDADGAGNADHSEHCCHAAAHLTALQSQTTPVDFDTQGRHRAPHRDRYTSLVHAPPIDPPIA